MPVARLTRIAGTASILVVVPLVSAMAQTQSPPSETTPPAATAPQPNPPTGTPQATPSTPPAERKFAAPDFIDLVGLTAKSSDGTNLGTIHSVIANPGGKTTIGVKVGSFLGFGGHMVAIPDGKFNRVGDTVQVNMTVDEVQKLPKAVEQK
jgi:hypothetical protein